MKRSVLGTHGSFFSLRWGKRVGQLWYSFTAPVEPPSDARLLEKTKARRGHLTSTIVAGLSVISVSIIPLWGVIGDPSLVVGTVFSLLCYAFALFFNRRGYITLAGTLVLVGFNVLILPSLLFPAGGLALADTPNFDLLAISDLIAVSMLPARSVWVMALLNCLFISIDVFSVPHTGDLGQAIAVAGIGIASRPVCLQLVTAIVVFLFVDNQEQAIRRADRSEEVSKLQSQLLVQKQEVEEQNRLLQASIGPIIETHQRVANGDFSARVPLNQRSVLWQVAGSLNNLLARTQRLRQEVEQAQALQEEQFRIRAEVARILSLIRSARTMAHHKPFVVEAPPGGTVIDAVGYELRSVALLERTVLPRERVTPKPQERGAHE